MPSKQAFDVDLAALLRVFGGHLYSTPAVFARELVQNALDAIALRTAAPAPARGASAVPFDPSIVVTVDPGGSFVAFADNGIGLDAKGLREHLSRVDARGGLHGRRVDVEAHQPLALGRLTRLCGEPDGALGVAR